MIWVGAVLFSLGVLIIIATTDCDLRVIVGTLIAIAGIIIFIEGNHPSAMDVYQGNTTLEITYRDGVPIDSVVAFKNK